MRHEFCLERALIKQRRPSGIEHIAVLAGIPRSMGRGKRTGNCFTASIDFMASLSEMGAKGINVQLFSVDGLHFESSMRLQRERFAVRAAVVEYFASEVDRVEQRSTEWVLGSSCKAHNCSNSVVWGLKRMSSKDLLSDAHISIASLRNSAEELHMKIAQFVQVSVRMSRQ